MATALASAAVVEGLVEHLQRYLGAIVGQWDTDPDGSALPYRIVHYARGPTTEVFSTLGLSDYDLGTRGARVELLIIAPAGLTAGSVPPMLHHVASMLLDVDDVPDYGDTFRSVDPLTEVSPMDHFYVARPLYQPKQFSPFDNAVERVHAMWLIPVYEQEAVFAEEHGLQAFEQLMWDLDVDPTDFTRDPWLE